MKKILLFSIAAMLFMAFGNKTGKTVSDTDSLAVDSINGSVVDKHSETYIRQRIDTIYGVKAGNKVRIYRCDYEIPGTKYTDDRNFAQVRRFVDAEKEAKNELRTVRAEQSAGALV